MNPAALQFSILLGFGFASLPMLALALAGAIPLLIHLLTRRKQTQVPWAAMQLLQQVLERESKRVRFEQWLLLLLRILVLVILAIALARPFLENAVGDTSSNRAPKLWIVGVDTSYSMGYRDGGASRFQLAKERAMQVIRNGQDGDAYALVELTKPAQMLIRRPTFDQERTLTLVNQLSLNDLGCDISGALNSVQQVASEALKTESLPSEIETVFISDLGIDGWQAIVDDNNKLIRELGKISSFRVLEIGGKTKPNVAITEIQPDTTSTLVDREVSIQVEVSNFGDSSSELPVQLSVNGQPLQSQKLSIAGNSSQVVLFNFTPDLTGQTVITANIPPDALPADDQRSCVVLVRESYKILCVEDRTRSSRLIGLSLAAAANSKQDVSLSTCSYAEFTSMDLSNWHALVINDAIKLPDEADRLVDYVQLGGAMILGVGPSANVNEWNVESVQKLTGFALERPSDEKLWSLDPLNYQSPVIAPFAGFPDTGLLTTPIFRYWQIDQISNDLVKDLAISNGDPLIIRNPVGDGWVACILSAPSTLNSNSGIADPTAASKDLQSWNTMATWPSFVPLTQQLVASTIGASNQHLTLACGELMLGKSLAKEPSIVEIVSPNGSQTELTTEQLGDTLQYQWLFPETKHSGVYRANYSDGLSDSFAVHLDPVQSDLASVPLNRVLQCESKSSDEVGNHENTTNAMLGTSIARILLFLVLGLLIAESIVAWKIGRRIG